MIEHDEEGAFGVVLNRPTSKTIQEVWEEVAESPCECNARINMGGPVMGPLLAVHTNASFAEAEILPGVFLASQREYLDQLVRDYKCDFRLFSGYAGWGEGQLESELQQGGWITRPATNDYVFADADELWEQVGKDITREVLQGALHIREFPEDPSLN